MSKRKKVPTSAGKGIKSKKAPAVALAPTTTKRPFAGAPGSAASAQRLTWRFGRMDMDGGPFPWAVTPKARLPEVQSKLAAFEDKSWAELAGGGNGHHSVSIAKLCKEARDRLVKLKHDDLDELQSLRLDGTTRVWGILFDRNVFYLLWWDPTHKVCPSLLKHT